MLLFVDRSPERAALAYQRMVPSARDRTIWCQTAEEAVKVLEDYSESLEAVMMDYDLSSGEYITPPEPETGMAIVKTLVWFSSESPEEFESYKDIKFIIHTHDEHKGKKMVEMLRKIGIKDARYQPFGGGE